MRKLEGPKIVTSSVPGPKAQALLEKHTKNTPLGLSQVLPTFVAQGDGALFEDVDGNVFLDFAGGIGVLNIGYSHEEVVKAVKDQADKFFHTMINCVFYEQYTNLAAKLNEIVPIEGTKKTLFLNSGAEADENAIKIARKYTKKTDVITFTGAFHGRTLLAMTLTSKVKPYKFGFGPFAPGVHRIEFPYCYRCPWGQDKATCGTFCATRLEDFFLEYAAPEDIAALIIEPVQGEGGFIVPPDEYLIALRKICDKYNIVMIADEVQSGMCRTGKMFACEYWPVKPDLVTIAKSIGGGIPLSAVTGKAEIMDAPHVGGIGGTYGGNPIGAAAGLKVIEVMQRDNFAEKSRVLGEKIDARLKKMQEKFPVIGDVRGLGSMKAIELVKDRKTKEPAKELVGQVVQQCWKNGLLILSAGLRGNVIRFLMPLVITDEQLNKGFDILEKALEEATK
ncbi:4-aminobutyrate--2-oxoglutarate transaminase [Synergistaceae bacterium OttesenSCG-928-I11]|nr:4-aminobutyrate--2-oxoglutarate transaminase [Synergistaceae bacterium OttesenSCG-928-I11]